MIRISLRNTDTGAEYFAEFATELGPALRSAIQEHRDELGERAKGSYEYNKEAALTRAIITMGKLAAGINHIIPTEDPNYA